MHDEQDIHAEAVAAINAFLNHQIAHGGDEGQVQGEPKG